MLGKGLESLIPKKNYASGTPHNDVPYTQEEEEYSSDFEDTVSREEREELGILSGLSSSIPRNTVPEDTHIAYEREEHISFRPAPQTSSKDIPTISGPVFHIETNRIVENPYQPRKIFNEEALNELASSIREFGVLQPLVVIKMDEETDSGMQSKYQLIAGHRRLLAARKVGLRTVPVVVRNSTKRGEALELAIVENIQRQDLNIVETARAYARLSDEFGLTQREIAARLGKSRESVANALRLLSLPTEIQDSLSEGKIQESHARILLQMGDMQKQKDLHRKIVQENLSVRDMKRALQSQRAQPREEDTHNPQSIELKNLEKELSEFLGAPVRVEVSQSGGKIIIHFYSPEEALGIAQKIKPEEA